MRGRERPDVLHAHWLLPNGFIAAVVSRRLGIPLAVSVPGSDAQVAGKNALFRRMAQFTFEQADLLTANSEALRDSVVALGADPSQVRHDHLRHGSGCADAGRMQERMRCGRSWTSRLARRSCCAWGVWCRRRGSTI